MDRGRTPASPKGWLNAVADRRLADRQRSEHARRRREETAARRSLDHERALDAAGDDDTLTLLFVCCHPALSAASQVALTLRAAGGVTTAEVARAFLVPEATMTRRHHAGQADHHLLGYAVPAASGWRAVRAHGRGAPLLHDLTPDDREEAGLLALMQLTDARRAARVGADGELVPLAEQDRTLSCGPPPTIRRRCSVDADGTNSRATSPGTAPMR